MAYQVSDETQETLDEIHEQGKALGRDGKAFVLTAGSHDSVIYWDTETEQWLHGNDSAPELGWVMFPSDDFPRGMEIIISWDEYEEVPVEETRLYHAAYGLDQARDGYGVNR